MKNLYCLFLLITSFSCSLNGQGLILEKVVANVGSEDIFYSDIQELYYYALAQNPQYGVEIQCDIVEQLITKKLLVDQAKIDSIEVTDVELTVELDRRIDYILGQMGGDENFFYSQYGKTPAEQKETMKEPMREQMIEQRIQSRLINDVEITPKEVIEFYESIPYDSMPFLAAEVELGEIAMKTMISDEVRQAAFDKLDGVRKRIIEEGESFEELASIYSDDPGSAAQGGSLGWAKRGSYVSEFEATAFSLEPGEISEIIETKFGYHLLELEDRRGNNIKVRHILVKPEITAEDVESTKVFLDSIKNRILLDSLSFELAVRRHGDEESQSYSNAGRLINPDTGDTFWETGQLPYQIYFAIEDVEVGGISEIIEMDERGEPVYKIIQMQTKTRPHRASLETDFNKIKQYAIQSKKNEVFNDWMDKKVKNTHISIAKQYHSCPNLQKYIDPVKP